MAESTTPELPFPSIHETVAERWLPVIGWEEFYLVSDQGRVRSLERKTAAGVMGGQILKPHPIGGRYLAVNLAGDGRRKKEAVHRLVAAAFIGPRPAGQQVRHKDGNEQHNAATNLEYGTSKQNHHDRKRHGTDAVGSRNGRAKITEDDARAILAAHAAGATPLALCEQYGRSHALRPTAVYALLARKTWRHVA